MRLISPVSLFKSRDGVAADKDRHGAGPPVRSDPDKYALLLKYSDKARASEMQLGLLPDDLRERFRREAVADPSRIAEITARLLFEDQNRRSPFGDPKLDTLYQMVKGDEEKAEGEQIADWRVAGRGHQFPNHQVADVVGMVETPKAREERRQRVAEITKEIKKLGRVFAGQIPSTATEVWTVFKPPQQTAEPAVALNVAGTESADSPQGKLRASSTKSLKWPLWLGAAAVAAALASFGGLALMFPALDKGQHHPVAAEIPQPRVSEEVASHEAAARVAEAEAATRRLVEEKRRAEEAEKKKAEEAAARREQETRKAEREEQQARIEAARQEAEAQDRAAAKEAERRQVAEARRAPDIAADKVAADLPRTKTEVSSQNSEATLNLSEQDRKQVQVALTALGHNVPATGYFGQITRAKITDWQKAQGLPPSGYLDSLQLRALQAQAASAGRDAGSTKMTPQADVALNLSEQQRKEVQVALTALGHPVNATGNIGPKTRAKITDWQKSQGLPPSGHLDSSQLGMLLQQAALAVIKYDQREPAASRNGR
jgi:peptidoglycan hydrolase-like protein with peptidoglycan-binding domain